MRELKVNSIFSVFDDDYSKGIKKVYVRQEPKKSYDNVKSFKNYIFQLKKPSSSRKTAKPCVVKMISNLSAKGTKNCLFYISKNSEDNLIINERGDKISPAEVYKEWQKDFGTNENSKDCWHLVFSVKDESRTKPSLEAIQNAVRDTLDKNFFGYKYAICVHNHQNNPHVHVVVNKRDIFTKKKIHFDSKDEIKDFFNEVRDDYASNLNSYGFNYYNVNAMAKDLVREKERAERSLNNAYDTKDKFKKVYNNMSELDTEKIIVKTTQKENVDKELEKNLLEHKHLIELLNQYNYYENKKKWQILSDIKKNNKKRKELCDLGKRIEKELKDIQKDIEKLNNSSKELYKNNASDYNILKSFCYEFEKKYSKTANKKSLDIYLKAKKELKELGNKIDCDLKNSVDSAVLYQKLFSKNENCFNIIKGLEMIDTNKYALSACDLLSDDEKKGYEKIFDNNEKFMREILEKRYEKIKEKVENNQNIKENDFLYKEYKKVRYYLKLDLENNVEKNNVNSNEMSKNFDNTQKIVHYQNVSQNSNSNEWER